MAYMALLIYNIIAYQRVASYHTLVYITYTIANKLLIIHMIYFTLLYLINMITIGSILQLYYKVKS